MNSDDDGVRSGIGKSSAPCGSEADVENRFQEIIVIGVGT